MKAWFIGLGLVIGAIAICLFPLWPRVVRNYVYYLSIAAAGFLFFIIGLAVLRLIVFCLVWLVSLGKHHLWLLPNLTEDVGFVQSFIPLYQYEYKGDKKDGKSDKKSKKDKDSDKEEEEKESSDSNGNEEGSQDGSEGSQHKGSDNGFEMLDPIEDGDKEPSSAISTE